jgi:hypothetical protein
MYIYEYILIKYVAIFLGFASSLNVPNKIQILYNIPLILQTNTTSFKSLCFWCMVPVYYSFCLL